MKTANVSLRVCLDFANTMEWHASDNPSETLKSYSDLLKWSEQAGLLSTTVARTLLREATLHSGSARKVLKRAIFLREVIYRIFSALAANRRPEKSDLALLNKSLSEAMARVMVLPGSPGFVWDWSGRRDALDRMLWPIVRIAAELLTSVAHERVRECSGPGCGWLFLDVSRNGLRRWCDMKSCGNRAKAQRHYERRKKLTRKLNRQ